MKKSNIECLKLWIDKTTPVAKPNRKQKRLFYKLQQLQQEKKDID